MRPTFRLALLLCCIVGVLFRLMLIIQSGWRIDYDEAMVGLLGLRVLRGEYMAFIPAQATLGALEPYLLAPLFAVFGASAVIFRVYSLATVAAYIATTGLLARKAFGGRVGILAALLSAFAPPYLLITGLKTWGATAETIVLGNLLLLLTVHAIDKRAAGWKILTVVGFIAGVMFWTAWLGFYYFVPVGLLLLWRGRAVLRVGWGSALIAFFAGSFPFSFHNFQNDFATFQIIFNAQGSNSSLSDILNHLVNDLLPRLVTSSASWGILPNSARIIVFALYYLGLLGVIVLTMYNIKNKYSFLIAKDTSENARLLLSLFTILLPIIYLLSGYGDSAFNPWGVDATGRYVLMLHTVLPIGVGLLAVTIAKRQIVGAKLIGAGVVALVVGLNVPSALRLDLMEAFDSPYYTRQPESLQPLIDYLDQHQITHVWVDAGIGQILMFVTNERIIAADPYDAYIAGGLLRFPDALATVAAAPESAFVVPIMPNQQDMPLKRAFDDAGIVYTFDYITPTLMIYIPAERVDPMRIAAGLGYQY